MDDTFLTKELDTRLAHFASHVDVKQHYSIDAILQRYSLNEKLHFSYSLYGTNKESKKRGCGEGPTYVEALKDFFENTK